MLVAFLGCELGWSQSALRHLYFNSTENIVALDFETQPPTVQYTGVGSGGSVGEGLAHLEDSTGTVVLWVNAGGVYDRNGDLMPGSVGIFADPSATEIAICPVPGDLSRYFLIYNQLRSDNQEHSPLFYSIVDLAQRNGAGDVTELNQSLDARSHGEGLEVVPIPCSDDYWVLAYRRYEGFVRFRVTATGLGTAELIAPFDAAQSGGRGELDYYQGRLGYAVAYRQRIWVGDFEPETGDVRRARSVSFLSYVSPTKFQDTGMYGLEFSPDGTKVYCTDFNNRDLFGNVVNPNLFCYDLVTDEIRSWTVPLVTQGCTGTPQGLGQIELASDGRLYVTQVGGCAITVIHQPDSVAPTFTIIPVGMPLSLGISDQIQAPVLRPFRVVADQQLCAGDATTLWATGGLAYQWTPAAGLSDPTSARPVARPLETTVYTVRVDRGNGCADSARVRIAVSPLPTLAMDDLVVCTGDSVALPVEWQAHVTYQLTHADSVWSLPSSQFLAAPGVYTLTATNEAGCAVADTFEVRQHLGSSAGLPSERMFCGPPPYVLGGSKEPNVTYRWSTGATTPTIEADSSGLYWLEATNGLCTVRDTVYVTIAVPPRSYNVITPNGDGRNEFLDFGRLAPSSGLFIYNRWGKQVYVSNNYQNDWQARNTAGEPLPGGVYYYFLHLNSDCGDSFKGWVEVVR
ncbi:gliding motility-associated C-terminal domain-containing protein [Catalinimonas alkaloidigena]|uniref:Gliding motility-associated C-terminal domain-containing protein n=2 Tax=Catalinimonas alkaloidigena TaxID=1075417 RepID=A0A1G9RQC0_9BACT|nr:gliding motility-associated C-terminal domain-containing protein [Catalinimonas alkaloidigena]